ncbi:sulfotransferase family protein [Marinobacter fuscus]|uniref:Sulfotransferase family protein n=1 Tax=Marinobacter fuscus TaxID=2109942 RepID=A0A2T1K3W0_9GAMM|nr:sulfotransferase [Marinobacter fuscus]PSF04854.1 sulfotransferase family protein [Marinobacter fuscus]
MALGKIKSHFMGSLPMGRGKGRVIVAGMPKSGTTAIATLLAKAANVDVCSDPFHQLDTKKKVVFRDRLFSEDLSLESLWRQHRELFRGTVVKDPNFPLLLSQLKQFLPEAQFVFIVREPKDNIRSILSRLKIPGNPSEGSRLASEVPGTWGRVLNGTSPDMPGNDYLEKLAWRWRISAERYLENRDGVRLIRYEDFRRDKQNQINRLAEDVGLANLSDISALVDVQFQPKGKRPESIEEFFGKDNLGRIESIVEPFLADFGYE